MENRAWLPYYSQILNYVEIDSTFYNIPSESMVRNWNERTPDNFRFTAKFPKIITHEKRFRNVEKDLELDRSESCINASVVCSTFISKQFIKLICTFH